MYRIKQCFKKMNAWRQADKLHTCLAFTFEMYLAVNITYLVNVIGLGVCDTGRDFVIIPLIQLRVAIQCIDLFC